ncbi:AraC family transcriptional regulator [Amycolatopsis pithecellobii]|uniref:Helix-turn-helix domain-containing protein n=1 Tax=Amycolatopsis pithecellobii TaxID=664692 RepID=A0A6N7YZM1_9PSEU|nr:AraC family transcriptional regulator [Amycolatopsis pithecellobii]MTD52680.1 helix-turn-helix domain-containing protein [Amycolatopsis pithecellobii]
MDLLADVLAVGGVRGTVAARLELGDTWGFSWSEIPGAVFYAVTSGTAWLGVPGHEPVRLMPGDVVLLPTGTAHTLSSGPGVATRSCHETLPDPDGVLRFGSGESKTHILGATYDYDPAVSTQVITLLPDIVHIRADSGATSLDDAVRLLARELSHPQLATTVVLDRLVDILLIQLLRVWLAKVPAEANGTWLGVLNDPLVGVAMAKLHEAPARAWTTESLAAELAVSRATLSRRFLAVAGETPGSYLTKWRMDLAAVRLRDTDDTLESVARAVGYTSVYAFSRAFRRARGQAPGRYRSDARTGSDAVLAS